ncbi:MAG: hypothetical protein MCM46_12770 [Candidatus Manganitrophus sp. SB1]|nr:hypothetical protein [Candidatus Manganitrophus morganii]
MKMRLYAILKALVGAVALTAALAACSTQVAERKPRQALFIGVDVSGSFQQSGYYDDAMTFLAHYIYGHLNELGGLAPPRELFVGSIGGKDSAEPKAFHPIHDFTGKSIPEIEEQLRAWFVPMDSFTDFNPFFQQVARIAKERHLTLSPITVMLVSDGIPDAPMPASETGSLYEKIDLSPLEYLSRNLTIRLAYASPKVGENWRKEIPRQRVRLWAVEGEVMKGWSKQVEPEVVDPAGQERLWKWVRDNVDYRVRSISG